MMDATLESLRGSWWPGTATYPEPDDGHDDPPADADAMRPHVFGEEDRA